MWRIKSTKTVRITQLGNGSKRDKKEILSSEDTQIRIAIPERTQPRHTAWQ